MKGIDFGTKNNIAERKALYDYRQEHNIPSETIIRIDNLLRYAFIGGDEMREGVSMRKVGMEYNKKGMMSSTAMDPASGNSFGRSRPTFPAS